MSEAISGIPHVAAPHAGHRLWAAYRGGIAGMVVPGIAPATCAKGLVELISRSVAPALILGRFASPFAGAPAGRWAVEPVFALIFTTAGPPVGAAVAGTIVSALLFAMAWPMPSLVSASSLRSSRSAASRAA